jgi:hypothetical protein
MPSDLHAAAKRAAGMIHHLSPAPAEPSVLEESITAEYEPLVEAAEKAVDWFDFNGDHDQHATELRAALAKIKGTP